MRVREVPTASGKHALQVVSKRFGKVRIHKHIGTYGDESQKAILYQKAQDFIQKSSGQVNFNDYLTRVSLSDIIIMNIPAENRQCDRAKPTP